MNTFEIALKTKQLPANVEELVPLRFIGESAVNFYKEKIKLFTNLDLPIEQRKKTLKDGQDAGILLLEIEGKIGELSKKIEGARPIHTSSPLSKGDEEKKWKKMGFKNSSQLFEAQTVNNHPEIKERIIKRALENDDIPTKTAVISEYNYEREKARRKKAEAKTKENKAVIRLEEMKYINALERIVVILPTKPPKDFGEAGFKMAKGYAEILINRLNVFLEEK